LINWRQRRGKKTPTTASGRPLHNLNSDPDTVDFKTAVKAVQKGKVTGIGLPIYQSDFLILDLDDCVVDGKIAPWALQILEECDSYAEFSPSGKGIHIFMKGERSGK